MVFNINNQQVGDILLVSGKSISSCLNRTGQLLTSAKTSKYSHAILCLEKGIYIESMKSTGVEIFCIDELKERMSSNYHDNWRVIRYKNLSSDKIIKIKEKSMYFYKQIYNTIFLIKFFTKKHKKDASFCSELIGRIYEGIDIKISDRDIFPNRLDRLTREIEWDDVTNDYNKKNTAEHDNEKILEQCKKIKSINEISYISAKILGSFIASSNDEIENIKNKSADIKNTPQEPDENILTICIQLLSQYCKIISTTDKLNRVKIPQPRSCYTPDLEMHIPIFTPNTTFEFIEDNISAHQKILNAFKTMLSSYKARVSNFIASEESNLTISNNELTNKYFSLKNILRNFTLPLDNDLINIKYKLKDITPKEDKEVQLTKDFKKLITEIHYFNYIKNKEVIRLDTKLSKNECIEIKKDIDEYKSPF